MRRTDRGIEREKEREREREGGARTQCSSRRGGHTKNRCCPPGGGGVVISFSFRGISLPRNNLSLLWAFSSHFGAYLKIAQAKDWGHEEVGRMPGGLREWTQVPRARAVWLILCQTQAGCSRLAGMQQPHVYLEPKWQRLTGRTAHQLFFKIGPSGRAEIRSPGIEPGTI